MKYTLFIFLSVVLFGCTTGHPDYPKAENALDAGREFIEALLKNDMPKAAFYMLADDQNNKLLEQYKHKFQSRSGDEQAQYKQAEIIIQQVEDISEKETIIHYSNSFDRKSHKVKIVLQNGNWLVDFKYTIDGNL